MIGPTVTHSVHKPELGLLCARPRGHRKQHTDSASTDPTAQQGEAIRSPRGHCVMGGFPGEAARLWGGDSWVGLPAHWGSLWREKEPQWAPEGERFGWEGKGRGGDRNSLCKGLQVTEAPLA